MERFLQSPIKELIERFPALGKILEDYAIGCVPCSVGTCLLRDIVEIHNLCPADEEELMGRIAAIVAPGQELEFPRRVRNRAAGPRKVSYSPPMKMLVEEHRRILRFVALIPALAAGLDVESGEGRGRILDAVDFIRSYADRFHHAKEEELLFACFDEELDILKAMREDHRRGRACVQGVLDALGRRDAEGASRNLAGYGEILTEHIRKEDEILYPWMDRNLTTRQVGELYARFREVDETFLEAGERYEAFVSDLEGQYLDTGAEVVR
ncbi:MAG: hemerythrin domain-containing protein [Candidatus Deferrimicrobiaceae bacterium]